MLGMDIGYVLFVELGWIKCYIIDQLNTHLRKFQKNWATAIQVATFQPHRISEPSQNVRAIKGCFKSTVDLWNLKL